MLSLPLRTFLYGTKGSVRIDVYDTKRGIAYVADLMQNMDDQNRILLCVQTVVESLNELNAKVDCQLIETEQREDLCQFILFSAQSYGLQSDADVTEKWREW